MFTGRLFAFHTVHVCVFIRQTKFNLNLPTATIILPFKSRFQSKKIPSINHANRIQAHELHGG